MKYLASLLYSSPVSVSAMCAVLHPVGILAGLVPALLIYLGIKREWLPIVQRKSIDGANGRNWPLYVLMDPAAPMYRAVLAQELYESIYKTNPVNLFRTRSIEGQRDIELMGHEVEVQAAVMLYGVKEAQYRRAEASAMQLGYECFRGMERYDIVEAMAAKTIEAQAWVARNQGRFA